MTKAVPLPRISSRPSTRSLKLDTIESITSVESIIGYTHYLLMKGQKAGNMMFDGHKPTPEERKITKQIQELCRLLEKRLPVCKESELADILDCYEMAYTVGYKRFPNSDMVIRLKQQVSKARNSELRDWVATLLKYDTFPRVTSYEKYGRLALIMKENLDSYVEDSRELKQRWYRLNKIDELTTLSTPILRNYRNFISSLPAGIISFEEKRTLDNRIVRELITRTDLDPYDSEAFRLLLDLNESNM